MHNEYVLGPLRMRNVMVLSVKAHKAKGFRASVIVGRLLDEVGKKRNLRFESLFESMLWRKFSQQRFKKRPSN